MSRRLKLLPPTAANLRRVHDEPESLYVPWQDIVRTFHLTEAEQLSELRSGRIKLLGEHKRGQWTGFVVRMDNLIEWLATSELGQIAGRRTDAH